MTTDTRRIVRSFLGWGGTALGVLGNYLIALGVTFLGGFLCFAASNVLFFSRALMDGDRPLLALQAMFMPATVFGIILNW